MPCCTLALFISVHSDVFDIPSRLPGFMATESQFGQLVVFGLQLHTCTMPQDMKSQCQCYAYVLLCCKKKETKNASENVSLRTWTIYHWTISGVSLDK